MKQYSLKGELRQTTGRGVKELRRNDLIPAVVYGRGFKNQNIQVVNKELAALIKEAGDSSIITLEMKDQEPINVLIKDISFEPVTDYITHLDFQQIRMDEEITTTTTLEFTGISAAVKNEGGILVKNFTDLEVTCLPADIPEKITVDISALGTFDDAIKLKDLDIPENVKASVDSEEVVAVVSRPRSEEELEALDEEVTEDVEGVEGVKKEEAEDGEESEGKEDDDKQDDDKDEKPDEDNAKKEESKK